MSVSGYFLMESPLGTLTLIGTDGVLNGLYMPGHLRGPQVDSFGPRVLTGFELVRAELDEYFAGKRRTFTFPIAPKGTPFQQRIWTLVRDIPYGETRTYAELADAIGNRAAIRAVGLANGKNPICIVIPCHRVLGSDGSLTGYAGGLERKRLLLEIEGRSAPKQASLFEPVTVGE